MEVVSNLSNPLRKIYGSLDRSVEALFNTIVCRKAASGRLSVSDTKETVLQKMSCYGNNPQQLISSFFESCKILEVPQTTADMYPKCGAPFDTDNLFPASFLTDTIDTEIHPNDLASLILPGNR